MVSQPALTSAIHDKYPAQGAQRLLDFMVYMRVPM